MRRLEGKHADRHDGRKTNRNVFKNRVVTCLQRKQLGKGQFEVQSQDAKFGQGCPFESLVQLVYIYF